MLAYCTHVFSIITLNFLHLLFCPVVSHSLRLCHGRHIDTTPSCDWAVTAISPPSPRYHFPESPSWPRRTSGLDREPRHSRQTTTYSSRAVCPSSRPCATRTPCNRPASFTTVTNTSRHSVQCYSLIPIDILQPAFKSAHRAMIPHC